MQEDFFKSKTTNQKKDFFSQRLALLVHFRQLVASCFIGLLVLPHVPSTPLGLLVSYVLVKLRKRGEENTYALIFRFTFATNGNQGERQQGTVQSKSKAEIGS